MLRIHRLYIDNGKFEIKEEASEGDFDEVTSIYRVPYIVIKKIKENDLIYIPINPSNYSIYISYI